MQSTGQTSMHASQPVQLSARMTASSLGNFLRVLPAPLAMNRPRSEPRRAGVVFRSTTAGAGPPHIHSELYRKGQPAASSVVRRDDLTAAARGERLQEGDDAG